MTFNSFTFGLFLIIVFGGSRLPISWTVRKWMLLLASYVFYAAWNPIFVLLLWLSTGIDWWAAGLIARTSSMRRRDMLLGISLISNLGLLAYFKYGTFLLVNVLDVSRHTGLEIDASIPNIVLPVGISFYTFQTLSYTLDVYRGVQKPAQSMLDFALYVTFFPQLVAGPIVRADEFLPQCEIQHRSGPLEISWGMILLLLGLFEKVVVADGLLSPVVEAIYGNVHSPPSLLGSWSGAIAFAGQIFCDFAGYSHCAIGTAMCLGFALPDNFCFPYAAEGFSDFWRRWHISLSTWLRDYLYIPLGGSRDGTWRTYRNLMVTMMLGGLWHGAAWTFIIWGALHGLLLIIERAVRLSRLAAWDLWSQISGRLIIRIVTLVVICFTWVPFRAKTWEQTVGHWRAMVGWSTNEGALGIGREAIATAWLTFLLLIAGHWMLRDHTLEALWSRSPQWLQVAVMSSMIIALCILPGEDRAFIYFQF